MSDPFDLFQALVLEEPPNFAAFRTEIARIQSDDLAGVELARSHALVRLSNALQAFFEDRAGTSDIVTLLRQVIRTYHRRLLVRRRLWQILSAHEHNVGLHAIDVNDSDKVELQAHSWQPSWLPDAHDIDIDKLRQLRFDEPVPGAGMMHAMTDGAQHPFSTYRSEAQKVAVDTSLFAPPGSTTLITLPTGGGKSMCIVLPAWMESGGGRKKGGTTLVVVPTIALALDQQANVESYFSGALDDEFRPHSLTSATSPEERSAIRRGLQRGTLPLLYTSPESLLNSELYQLCLAATSDGHIHRLVIDEAHLVETWGARFRTEFQLLASYRNKLLQASKGHLRTLLLSATISETCKRTLRDLFAVDDTFYTMQANRLRPEISYWFNYAPDEETRQSRVLEAVYHLPRPLILYVTSPKDADDWVEVLRQEGFERVAAFSGKTESNERLRLIHEWNQDQRDIMVATSAFGLGVDKSDVRTVLHATLPENVDRFYQEVGRGGRDDCSSISLVCLTQQDYEKASRMIAGVRITPDKAWGRWAGMWRTAEAFNRSGDYWQISTNAAPEYNLDMDESRLSQEWNEHVLLLMQRAGILKIVDTRPNDPEQAATDGFRDQLLIQLIHPDAANSKRTFNRLIQSHRDREVRTVYANLRKMQSLASDYSSASTKVPPSRCLAHRLDNIYAPTTLACGGCFSCREQSLSPYSDSLEFHADTAKVEPSAEYLEDDFRTRVGGRHTLKLVWDKPGGEIDLDQCRSLLAALVGVGIQQVVLSPTMMRNTIFIHALVKDLSKHWRVPHRIISADWLYEPRLADPLVYPIPTTVVYPMNDDEEADRMYTALTRWSRKHAPDNWIVHILHRELRLPRQFGRFLDRVDGLEEGVQRFMKQRKESQSSLLF